LLRCFPRFFSDQLRIRRAGPCRGPLPAGVLPDGRRGCRLAGLRPDGADGYYDELPPRNYPSAEELQAMAEASIKAEQWREAERMKDPVYRKLKEGYWYYPEGDEGRGDVCMATFLSTKGGAVMMDWAGDQKGTFLAFFGAGIPRAKEIRKMKVTLIQSGERQTVKAFHAPFFSSNELGMVMFAVPSTDALISSIEDVQDFEVKQSYDTLILGEWHSGHEARDYLAGCVAAR
jgi:hypothetical protein